MNADTDNTPILETARADLQRAVEALATHDAGVAGASDATDAPRIEPASAPAPAPVSVPRSVRGVRESLEEAIANMERAGSDREAQATALQECYHVALKAGFLLRRAISDGAAGRSGMLERAHAHLERLCDSLETELATTLDGPDLTESESVSAPAPAAAGQRHGR